MKNSLTSTRWTGRSSSSASDAPMRNSPAGMRAKFGAAVAVIVRADPGGFWDPVLSSPVTKGQYSPGRRDAFRAGTE